MRNAVRPADYTMYMYESDDSGHYINAVISVLNRLRAAIQA